MIIQKKPIPITLSGAEPHPSDPKIFVIRDSCEFTVPDCAESYILVTPGNPRYDVAPTKINNYVLDPVKLDILVFRDEHPVQTDIRFNSDDRRDTTVKVQIKDPKSGKYRLVIKVTPQCRLVASAYYTKKDYV